ncbi:hypothetical protein BKA66DRAFT_281863 [Pyrenochaeta sp. MPI-SDFR-AT-0127]|nr:hypothetical protein BKA66DRAFT_281863 [Pyrenochaeta sp. MPI-SDFR-AT-0127]
MTERQADVQLPHSAQKARSSPKTSERSARPSAASGGDSFQLLWSCTTCRRRKVKCDKKSPCSNCVRAKIECILPTPSRSSRRPRKPANGELLERLARLEGVINTLKSREPMANRDDETTPFPQESDEVESFRQWRKVANITGTEEADGVGYQDDKPSTTGTNTNAPPELDIGRLVINEGGSRYVNNSFWATLDNEVESLKGNLMEPSDGEEDQPFSPATQNLVPIRGLRFGFSSGNIGMLSLHTSHALIPRMWAIFKTNVDPLVKVLHVPTMEPKVLDAKDHLENLPKGIEALMFAIYYSVVTSLTPEECVGEFGETRDTLLARYRFALEQILVHEIFIDFAELMILQALVIFLTVLRRNENARVIWKLTGLVVRVAQVIGVHKDGTHFGLAPFEIEMRRRLWWQLCIMDARASEDHGCDPTILDPNFDTQMPLNVNDCDLYPSMVDLPESRNGFTEMTFCLVGFELANVFRRVVYSPPGRVPSHPSFATLNIMQKERWITECHQRLEKTYLADLNLSIPPSWVAATLTRLVLSKIWLIAYHPFQRLGDGVSLPQQIKEKLFLASLESVEYANLLDNDPRTRRWNWLFRTYTQWNSIAFLLSELCIRTQGSSVERAWRAIEVVLQTRFGNVLTDPRRVLLWRPLRRVMAQARMAREKILLAEHPSLENGVFKFVESCPAIYTLLGWVSISGAASEQFLSLIRHATTNDSTCADPFDVNLSADSHWTDQVMGGFLDIGFDCSITGMGTDPPKSQQAEIQPSTYCDPQQQHMLAPNASSVVPGGSNYHNGTANMGDTPHWPDWDGMMGESEDQVAGSNTVWTSWF